MELGLLYYQARYYLPGVGRFLSADTIVPDSTNPQSWNKYSYVYNNPLRYTDPTGHYIFEDDPSEPYTPPTLPSYVPDEKFSTWPIDPQSPGYSTNLQGFGDTETAWSYRNKHYGQLGRLHSAFDIFVDKGATVSSLGRGKVVCTDCGATASADTDSGIAIYHYLCSCVVYYVHLSAYSVALNDEVEAGTPVGLSGTGFGYEHLHLEIRPYMGAAEFYNPKYFFEPKLLADLTYQEYHNSYDNPESRIIGYTSKDAANQFHSYWTGPLPAIDVLFGKTWHMEGYSQYQKSPPIQ